jgi:hypothetical protein
MLGRTPPCAIVTWPRSLQSVKLNKLTILVQLLIIADGELEMAGDDTGWLCQLIQAKETYSSCYHERRYQPIRGFQLQGILGQQRDRLIKS